MMKPARAILFVLLTGDAGFAKDFPVADFGETGNGKTDDGPAIRKAVAAAVAAGAGSRVVFEENDVYGSLGFKPPQKDWGVVSDSVERHRRWDVAMQFYMKEFVRSPAGADVVRVVCNDESKKDLAKVRPGDRYVIPFIK